MALACGRDPLVCIDTLAWAIGEFLRDWTTLAMLALLLGLLLKLRADRQKAREDDYARRLEAYEEKRILDETQGKTWGMTNDKPR